MPRKAPIRSSRARSRNMFASSTTPVPTIFADVPVNDKQALIADHAARRAKHPTGNIFGMYVGVAICTILVLVGWAIALPRTLMANQVSKPDAAIRAVTSGGSALGKSFSGDGERLREGGKAAGSLIKTIQQETNP